MSRKSLAVAQCILDECRNIGVTQVTPMQLLKLVYIAHGYMLAKHDRPLLDEPVEAWQYGPVVPSLYRAIRDFRSAPVSQVPWATPFLFSPQELDVIRTVARTYGNSDAIVLSAATHKEGTPWSVTFKQGVRNLVIPNEIIERFYKWILSLETHNSL